MDKNKPPEQKPSENEVLRRMLNTKPQPHIRKKKPEQLRWPKKAAK